MRPLEGPIPPRSPPSPSPGAHPRGEPPPRRAGRWLRLLLGPLLIGLTLSGAGLWWFHLTVLSTLPEDLSTWRGWRPPTTCVVRDAQGGWMDEFSLERRYWVDLDQLPPHVVRAFLAAEDRRFYEHGGVDPAGILRALWTNLTAGGVQQGGSTITQQLVKNLIVGDERSYTRKMKEAVLAGRLEQELSKDRILELFVNYVFLGAGNYGVEAAARDYFGVSARELDPGQAALIAGLIPAPSRYNPRRSAEQARVRRKVVLQAMVAEGVVTDEVAQAHLDDPVLIPRDGAEEAPGRVGLDYATQVRRELRRYLPPEAVFHEGYEVHAGMDPAVQAAAEAAVRAAVEGVDARQGRRGPKQRIPADQRAAWLQRAPGLRRDVDQHAVLAPAVGDCFPALVDPDLSHLHAGPHEFSLRDEDRALPIRAELPGDPARPLSARAVAGDVLSVCLGDDGRVGLDPRPWGEGAAVVIAHDTGRVVALVGGARPGLEGFVRAVQARRQPGSSFKPYVYAAALMAGRGQLDIVVDGPISMPAGNGKTWSPQNYNGAYMGALPLREALARSLNTVAVKLTLEVGAEEVARVARAMGVRTPLRIDPTLGLGSSEVSPLDQAVGYSTIARMGVPVEPSFVERLVDPAGEVVARAGEPVLVDGVEAGRLPGAELPRALPAGVSYELADMLREVVRAGTARKAHDPTLDRAGKTGTTNDYVDAWFVGFTPTHTIAVWVGSDSTSSLGDSETGGRSALPAWIQIADALPKVPGQRLRVPDEAVLLPVDGRWLGFARGRVPARALKVAAVRGAVPAFGGG